jgi:hypothetical protein
MSRQVRIAAAALALLGASPAWAHHSFAMFDMANEKTLAGTVKDFEWTNPHSWLWLEVANPSGEADLWGLEGMSPNFLERRGWSKHTLNPGDKVSVVIHPLKNGQRGGEFMSVTLPDGKVMYMFGGPPTAKP